MPEFGTQSKARLNTLDPNLREVLNRVIKWYNFTILEGHRTQELQDKAFAEGRSKIKWPDGKHNTLPSEAVDIAPYPVDWSNSTKNIARFYILAGAMMQAAQDLEIELRWGGDWDGDLDLTDQSFDDLPHFELRRKI